MEIRKAVYDDIPMLMHIFECAKGIMRASGNMHQWGDGYPSCDIVEKDIDAGVCYVMCDENGVIVDLFDCSYTFKTAFYIKDDLYLLTHLSGASSSGSIYLYNHATQEFTEIASSVYMNSYKYNSDKTGIYFWFEAFNTGTIKNEGSYYFDFETLIFEDIDFVV